MSDHVWLECPYFSIVIIGDLFSVSTFILYNAEQVFSAFKTWRRCDISWLLSPRTCPSRVVFSNILLTYWQFSCWLPGASWGLPACPVSFWVFMQLTSIHTHFIVWSLAVHLCRSLFSMLLCPPPPWSQLGFFWQRQTWGMDFWLNFLLNYCLSRKCSELAFAFACNLTPALTLSYVQSTHRGRLCILSWTFRQAWVQSSAMPLTFQVSCRGTVTCLLFDKGAAAQGRV